MKRLNGEGTLRRRKDGTWEARYYDKSGKRHSVYAKTKQEAKEKLENALNAPQPEKHETTAAKPGATAIEADAPEEVYPDEPDMTVAERLQTWRQDFTPNIKGTTAIYYDQLIRCHIVPFIGEIKLKALRAPAIQRLYNDRQTNGHLSAKSIKNLHGCLHKALAIAVRVGYLERNPTSACILPRIQQKEIEPLDVPDLKKLLMCLHGEEYESLILTALFTGMRSGELIGLTWDCVDFEKGVIHVTKQMVTPRKKGEPFHFSTTKNGKERTLTPAPFVMDSLRQHWKDQVKQRERIGPAWNSHEFPYLVFTHADGSHLSQPSVWKILQKMLAKAGLEHHRFHDLRHTYVVNSIRAGDDIKTIQENAGHYSASFTLDRYGHVTETMKRESADRMQSFYAAL